MTDSPPLVAAPAEGSPARAAVLNALALAGLIYLLLTGVPLLALGPPLLLFVLSVLATLVFLGLSVLLVVQLARLPLSPAAEIGGAVLAGGVWWGLSYLSGPTAEMRLYLQPAGSIFFVGLCVFAGRLLSRIIRDPNLLLPVGLVAIIADLFTVAIGPTARALEEAPQLVQRFSVGLPQAGSAAGPEGAAGLEMLANMGVGDFVFLALFFTAAARFGFAWRRGAGLIVALVSVAILLFFALPLFGVFLLGIPLLPFIAGGFLWAYRDRFRLSPAERQALWWGALLLAVILGGLAVAVRL